MHIDIVFNKGLCCWSSWTCLLISQNTHSHRNYTLLLVVLGHEAGIRHGPVYLQDAWCHQHSLPPSVPCRNSVYEDVYKDLCRHRVDCPRWLWVFCLCGNQAKLLRSFTRRVALRNYHISITRKGSLRLNARPYKFYSLHGIAISKIWIDLKEEKKKRNLIVSISIQK